MEQRPLRVLYVDDDTDIRTIVKITLDGTPDIELQTAASGSDGLVLAQQYHPDLVLLDVMMPGMDGPTTLQHLRAMPGFAETPVAFVTAKVQPAEVNALLLAGAAAVISKPFNPARLAEQIRTLVKQGEL